MRARSWAFRGGKVCRPIPMQAFMCGVCANGRAPGPRDGGLLGFLGRPAKIIELETLRNDMATWEKKYRLACRREVSARQSSPSEASQKGTQLAPTLAIERLRIEVSKLDELDSNEMQKMEPEEVERLTAVLADVQQEVRDMESKAFATGFALAAQKRS